MSEKNKVLFLINNLGGGGAERVLVNLVNRLDREKYDITVQTMFSDGINKEFLSNDIKHISTNAPSCRGISYFYRFIPASVLYRYFIKQKYDLVVAYLQGPSVKVLSGCKDKGIKKIAWLHNSNPKKSGFFTCWFNDKMAFKAYNSFDAIAGVADTVVKDFADYTGIKQLYTVYNTNDSDKIKNMALEKPSVELNSDVIEICTAGRLVDQKGYDRLINAAKRLCDEGFKFRISIMGKGPESYKKMLEQLVVDTKTEDCIRFLGFQNNPYAIMAASDLYVLSSRKEGLATVLTEALYTGLPICATDVSGTREVLGDNDEYGIVTENSEDGIYEGLKKYLSNPDLLTHYREKSLERASFFDAEKTVKQAEDLFDKIISDDGRKTV